MERILPKFKHWGSGVFRFVSRIDMNCAKLLLLFVPLSSGRCSLSRKFESSDRLSSNSPFDARNISIRLAWIIENLRANPHGKRIMWPIWQKHWLCQLCFLSPRLSTELIRMWSFSRVDHSETNLRDHAHLIFATEFRTLMKLSARLLDYNTWVWSLE